MIGLPPNVAASRAALPACCQAESQLGLITARWIRDKFASTNNEALTVDYLDRWVLSGAHWQVVDISNQRVVVDLCACTGEPVERRQSEDPAVIDHLRTAHSDLDLA
jgi:hypothetical protein